LNKRVLIGILVALACFTGGAAVFVIRGGLDRTTIALGDGSSGQVIEVRLVDSYAWFDITPDIIEVEAGVHLVLDVVNAADATHDLEVAGQHTRMLAPGESQQLDLGIIVDDITGRCTIGEHDAAGMTLHIHVEPPRP